MQHRKWTPIAISMMIALTGQSAYALTEADRQAVLQELASTAEKNTELAVQQMEKQGVRGTGMVNALLNLGSLQMQASHQNSAQNTFEKAVRTAEESKEPGAKQSAITARLYVGQCLTARGDTAGAAQVFQSALKAATALPHTESLQLRIYQLMAVDDLKAQKLAEAELHASKALAIYDKTYGDRNMTCAPYVMLLAEIKGKEGNTAESERLFKEALSLGPDSLSILRAYAEFLKNIHRNEEASVEEKKADELQRRGENIMLNTYMALKGMDGRQRESRESDWGKELQAAQEAQKSGDFQKALVGYKSVLTTLSSRNQLKAFRDLAWEPIHHKARDYQKSHQYAKAAALMQIIAPHAMEMEGETCWAASILVSLGSAEMNAGHLPQAEQAYHKAVELFARTTRPDDPRYCYALNDLALCLQRDKKVEEAERTYKDILTSHISESMLKQDQGFGVRSVVLLDTLRDYALLMYDTGHAKRADALMARAKGMLKWIDARDELARMQSMVSIDKDNGKTIEAQRSAKVLALFQSMLGSAR